MRKSKDALPQQSGPQSAGWTEREAAAYGMAEAEIGRLAAGEAFVYHEGNLAIDIGNDPEVAGRAAAFHAAAEANKGTLAQRRLGSNAISISSGARIVAERVVTANLRGHTPSTWKDHGRLSDWPR